MDEAIEVVCAKHIHQCLWLPPTESHGKLRVTFATTSNFSDNTLPVILFCPPMFGGRSLALHFDYLAKQTGVRLLCADRPGMGGSTPVPLNIRIQVWLEAVPVLLKHLQISHVSLVCHSAGTLYALNALYHFREMLDPHAPYIGLLAPWVDNVHSHTALMNMASILPTGVIDNLSRVTKFVNERVVPVTSWSGGIVSSSMSLFKAEGASSDPGSTTPAEKYGVDNEVGKEIERLSTKCFFEEDVTAGNEEAKLCLKKAGSGLWGTCEDYMEYVKLVNGREQQRLKSEPETDSARTKLQLQVYFAESDALVGKAGQEYFDKCWQQDDRYVQFETHELPGTDHDTILLDYKKGALRPIFEQVHKLYASPA